MANYEFIPPINDQGILYVYLFEQESYFSGISTE